MLSTVERYLKTLEGETNKLFDQFKNNYFKSKISKCDLLTTLDSPTELLMFQNLLSIYIELS